MWAERRHRLRNGRRGRSKGHVVPSMDWPRQSDFVGGFTAVDQVGQGLGVAGSEGLGQEEQGGAAEAQR